MNIRSIYLAGLFAIIGSHIINTNAQQLRNPFDFPILLSGNFGELRSNHFHSGIDFKTQGVEGKPVHTVQEGYVRTRKFQCKSLPYAGFASCREK